jgi:hypothetical protein
MAYALVVMVDVNEAFLDHWMNDLIPLEFGAF